VPENASFLLIKTRKSRDAYLEDYFLEKPCARTVLPKKKGRVFPAAPPRRSGRGSGASGGILRARLALPL
jgi:hypothetical protein